MGLISLKEVPDELHREFKALCAHRGTSIRAELIRLMQQELEQAGKKGGR